MTQTEANLEMLNTFEELLKRSQSEGVSNSEIVALADSAHKLYITLTNANVFATTSSNGTGTIN